MKWFKRLLILHIFVMLLTGCLYPQGELSQNQVPNDVQLNMVQEAVEEYQEMTGGLIPIRTKDSDTPIYEKYLIDFTMLKEENILADIPGTAYENGGIYQYVIIDPEEDMKVKLIDLRLTEKLREINVKIDIYRSKGNYPPFGDVIAQGVYQVNYERLGYKAEPHVVSPITQNNLPFVMDDSGTVYIDYRIDLYELLQDNENDFTEGDDIRSLITDYSPFVPAYSLPYTIRDGEPSFLFK